VDHQLNIGSHVFGGDFCFRRNDDEMADANAPHSYHAPHDGQPLMYIMINILSKCKYVSSFMTALAEFGSDS